MGIAPAGIAPQAPFVHQAPCGEMEGRQIVSRQDDGYLRWILGNFPESSPWKAASYTLIARGEKKEQREAEKVIYNVHTLLTDLKSCSMRKDLQWAKRIHVKAVESGHASKIYVVTALIRMYAKCSSMVDARRLFDSTKSPNLMCWSAILLGYVENGDGLTALELFSEMKACGCVPDSLFYVAALKACKALVGNGGGQGECLKRGREIHSEIGCKPQIFVQNTLIDIYAKGGSMAEARQVFDSIQNPDVVSWTALLQGYADNGNGLVTLELFSRMKECGCEPDSVTYIAALKACTSLASKPNGGQDECLKWGRKIHSEIGCGLHIFVQNTLVDMYTKGGSMVDARRVFNSIRKPDVVSWNALLLGYVESGDGLATMELFSKMKASGFVPNSVTHVAALTACTSLAGSRQAECLKWGREIHSEIGYDLNIFVQSALIDMYAKCGSMVDARRVFDFIQKPNVVSWTALLSGYAQSGDGLATLELFSKMKASKCAPDSVAYVAALKACTTLAMCEQDADRQGKWLKRGKEIHSEMDCDLDIFVQSTLIDMYAKCGRMDYARYVFDSIQKPNVVSWTTLLQGYTENGDGLATLDLFSKMKASECTPDSVTYVAALKACTLLVDKQDGSGQSECLKRGREIHSEIGYISNIFVQSTLIIMYGKCGSMVEARNVFDSIRKPDLVSWNAVLLGYAENGNGLATLELFSEMKACGLAPDSLTYLAALMACGLLGSLALGRKFHAEISEFTAHVVTCLIDFYVKCGSILEAREVFDAHSRVWDTSTWTALLTGYGSFGDTVSVFKLFEAMQDEGFKPDAVTFVCMLSCCSHAGFLQKAMEYLEAMPIRYGINPTVMHYNCIIDILGRTNQLNEAIALLQEMPCNPDSVTWMTVLGACCKWKNVETGKFAFQSLLDMDMKNAPAYVLMANIYGSRGMWEEQERVLEARMKLDGWKLPGQAMR